MYRHNTEKLFKWTFSAFALVFPFFFLPQIDTVQVLTEKAVLIFFAIVFLFIQLVDVFISKRFSFNDNLLKRIATGLALCFVFSTLLSKNISLSFWGNINEANDLLILISSFVIFFAASFLKRRDIIRILEYFVAGSAILSIMFLIQKFTNIEIALFNAPESSAILIAIAFVVVLCFAFNNLRYFRNGPSYNYSKIVSMGVFVILFSASILIIGYKLAWLFVAAGMFFVFWRSMLESKFNIKRKKSVLSLAMLLIFFSLFFLPNLLGKESFEQKLSYEKSFNVSWNVLTENPKNFLFGSGLGTFAYDYSLYKGKDMGMVEIVFTEATFPFLTIITTTGIISGALILLLFYFVYKKGFYYFINYKKENGDSSINVRDLIFPIVFCVSLLMFFYKIDSVFLFLTFFIFGLWNSQEDGKEKNIKIPGNFIKTIFGTSIIFILICIFNFINYCRAGVYYEKAINIFKNSQNTIETTNYLEKSFNLWKTSRVEIGLSQMYLIKASEELETKWTTAERKEKQKEYIKEYSKKSEDFASNACLRDPNNFETWKNLGLIYENTNPIGEDRKDDAIEAYNRAIELAPYNTEIYFYLGRIYESKNDNENALYQYEKSFELNPLDKNLTKKINSLRSSQKIN